MSATLTAPIKITNRRKLMSAIEQLGQLDVRIEAARLARAKAQARLTAKHDPDITAMTRVYEEQRDLIRDYVRAHRDDLLGAEVRVMTEAGEIAIEALPAKTEVKDEKAVIVWIAKQGRAFAKKYLRVTPKPNLDAIKRDGVAVEGVTVLTGREKVVITPITSGAKVTAEL